MCADEWRRPLQVAGNLVAVWEATGSDGSDSFGAIVGCVWLVDRSQHVAMSYGAVVCCFPTADELRLHSPPGPDSYYLMCAPCCTVHRVGSKFTGGWQKGLFRRWKECHTQVNSTNSNKVASASAVMPGVAARHYLRAAGLTLGLANSRHLVVDSALLLRVASSILPALRGVLDGWRNDAKFSGEGVGFDVLEKLVADAYDDLRLPEVRPLFRTAAPGSTPEPYSPHSQGYTVLGTP